MTDSACSVSRRAFLKTGAAFGTLAAAGGSIIAGNGLFEGTPAALADEEEEIRWSHCAVNCGGACAFQFHVKDGEILFMESDNTGDDDAAAQRQMRACLRGRSIRRWLQSPDRLNYPMKRAEGARRGDGAFERISWDEALDTIAGEIKRIYESYGPASVYCGYGTGIVSGMMGRSADGSCVHRLLNLMGGWLDRYGDYSSGQYEVATSYMLGPTNPLNGSRESNFLTLQEGQLVLFFGYNPGENRMSGGGLGYDLIHNVAEKHCRVIIVDYRYSDTMFNRNYEWIPIRPGTDAALISAIVYELIENDWADEEFIHRYCIGYDEETLPESARGKHASYKDYILGNGEDATPKTPEWAAAITQIPAEKIRELARDLGTSDPVFITQGYGPQRRSNGELTAMSIATLPFILGQAGKPGTNTGGGPGSNGWFAQCYPNLFPEGENPVKVKIPNFMWTECVDHGEQFTKLNAGLHNADKLDVGIKMIFLHGGNMLTNQNSDINTTHDILADEGKCEFIVVSDVFMTDSAKYADILLPDLTVQEQYDFAPAGYCESVKAITFGSPVYEPKFERKGNFDVCLELAERLGVKEEFAEGKYTREDWIRYLYENVRAQIPELPTFDEGLAMGVYRSKEQPVPMIGMENYFKDPDAFALATPSGKIELYSEQIAEARDTWELADDEVISPIPIYTPGFDHYTACTEEYPLMVTAFHYKKSTHSVYANNSIIEASAPHWLWMNPTDAAARGISDGDEVRVFNDHGEIRVKVKVTSRIIPGVVSMAEGQWHNADMNGDRIDYGGCINTLTGRRPSPLGKQNPQHSNIGQVEKVEG